MEGASAQTLPWPVGSRDVPEWSRAPYPYARTETVRLDARRLGRCLALATLETTPTPSLNRNRSLPPYEEDRFFWYLVGSRRVPVYSSGHERDLRDWVLQQPDASIDPVAIYRQSLVLNHGNVWNAVLAIHQLLRGEARWFDPVYAYESSFARQTEFFRHFIDIRGDLRERDRTRFTGDHAGSWYRIWGMMLSFLSHVDSREWADHFTRAGRESSVYIGIPPGEELFLEAQRLSSELTATLAEWVKPLTGEPEDDWRKAEYNRAAANAAAEMTEQLFGNNHENPATPALCADAGYYVRGVE